MVYHMPSLPNLLFLRIGFHILMTPHFPKPLLTASIVTGKQANKPKREEWVDDYKLQLGAYYLAHKKNYGPIEQGVIGICTRGLQYQEFKLNEAELSEYGDKFLERVEQFKKLQ